MAEDKRTTKVNVTTTDDGLMHITAVVPFENFSKLRDGKEYTDARGNTRKASDWRDTVKYMDGITFGDEKASLQFYLKLNNFAAPEVYDAKLAETRDKAQAASVAKLSDDDLQARAAKLLAEMERRKAAVAAKW